MQKRRNQLSFPNVFSLPGGRQAGIYKMDARLKHSGMTPLLD
jgi:hypothetical protein